MPLVGSWLDCIGGARAHGAPPKKPTQLRKPRLMAHSLLQLQKQNAYMCIIHLMDPPHLDRGLQRRSQVRRRISIHSCTLQRLEMNYMYPEKPLGIGSVHTYVRWERVVCDVAPHLHHAQAKLRGACNWVLDFLKTQGNEDEQADNICGGGKLQLTGWPHSHSVPTNQRDREAEKNARREREESG
uniref:Uncharacterized protein n=1 Tax=Oryza meridionalis TaxID=40149 RepID=A0A0E0DJS9_9ORYZ